MTKTIVFPGQLITEERKRLGQHVYLNEGKIYSDVIGISKVNDTMAYVVPLEGGYEPNRGDIVIGVVTEEKVTGYMACIDHIYQVYLSKKEIRDPIKPGTIFSGKVFDVNELKEPKLENIRVFFGGDLFRVSPVKVPRIIGKNCSMLNVLKNGTKSNVVVGHNGLVWAKGGDIKLLKKAIRKIEAESHLEKLTDRMTQYLEEQNMGQKGEDNE